MAPVIEDDGFPALEVEREAGDAALPESGDLAQISPVRLYGLAAAASASGWLQLELEKGHLLQISFRKGTPEHLSSDDPALSILRTLLARGLVSGQQGLEAEEQASRAGQDLISVLFQRGLIPPSEAHKLLGDHALFLLDRALATWRGKFSFERDAPSPPGAYPLGQRWKLLSEAARRIDAAALRARLGRRLHRPVQRSGGLAIGTVGELGLTAQEARLYASIDGTRTGEELLKQQDPPTTLRLLYLLTELGHLAFAALSDAAPSDPPPPAASPPASSAPAAPAPVRAPEAPAQRATPRELPKITRPPPPPKNAAPSRPPPALAPASPAAAAKAPPAMRPAPIFANPPANETPQEMQARLTALLERLQKADHFEALGLDRKNLAPGEAKRNFFVLARELHPDTVTDPAQTALRDLKERLFARINEASGALSDDARRKAYERELDGAAASVDVGRIFAAEENFQRAEIMIKARRYADGLALLEEAIALNANEAEFFAWRGYARFLVSKDRKADYPAAAEDCRKAIRMIEKCLPAHLFLGHMAKAMADTKLAEQCYRRVLQLDPKHVDAQRELRLMGKRAGPG